VVDALDLQHVLVQPFQVCGHHNLAADNAGLIGAALFGHSRHHLLANAAIAASRRKFASDAAQVGPVLLVSASPEPPSAIPVELTAGAITEEPRTFKAPHPVRAFGTSGRLDFAHLGNLLARPWISFAEPSINFIHN
jgi:hypothetical protein